MTLTDRTIAALRHNHDHLADVVGGLSERAAHGTRAAPPSGRVADVLSHLGSGSEINRYAVERAIGEATDAPEHQEVWDRWNALSPAEQAAAFVESIDALGRRASRD